MWLILREMRLILMPPMHYYDLHAILDRPLITGLTYEQDSLDPLFGNLATEWPLLIFSGLPRFARNDDLG